MVQTLYFTRAESRENKGIVSFALDSAHVKYGELGIKFVNVKIRAVLFKN